MMRSPFFLSDTYDTDVKICNTETPSLFIMNNLLNVLKAKDGWTTLESIWNRVRPGDYLAICGLTPEQLESHKLKRLHEDDGIVEYKDASGNFYKSAISSSFYDYLVQKLQGANLVIEETFRFPIKPEPMHIKSRRSLTVRKMS